MIGKILGNYKILKQLGEGGMGTVYLGLDLTLEREVALKVISPELVRKPGLMTRFKVEAIAQAKLNHSNITSIYSFDQQKDIYYIVMEYVEGQTLKAIINQKGPMPLNEALEIFSQILSGVGYAHAKGVVHRDIKPSNIFLDLEHTAKIGDFGIAKVEGIEGLTKLGSTLGSPLYCSPEQVLGKPIDPRTDVYSLGMTLFEMLTGQLPFTYNPDSDYKMMQQVLEKEIPVPSSLNPTIPAAVDAILLKSLAKSVENRFQDVAAFQAALQPLIQPMNGAGAPVVPMETKTTLEETSGATPIATDMVQDKHAHAIKAPINRKQKLALAMVLGIMAVALVIFIVSSSNTGPITQGSTSRTNAPSPQPTVKQTTTPQQKSSDFPSTLTETEEPGSGTKTKEPLQVPAKQPVSSPPSASERPNVQPPKTTASAGEPLRQEPAGGTLPAPRPQLPVTQPDTVTPAEEVVKASAQITATLEEMESMIRREHYSNAIRLGERAIATGNVSGEIYLKLAKAYFFDKKRADAREYYKKAMNLLGAFRFPSHYQFRKSSYVSGDLEVTASAIAFYPTNPQNESLGFSRSMSEVKRVSDNLVGDMKGFLKKKKNRKAPELIIKASGKYGKKRYFLRIKGDSKLRGFVRDIIETFQRK